MGQYNFISPGAAAGAGIEEVLIRQREDARKALLDEVTRANAESQRKATEANIKNQNERLAMEKLGVVEKGLEPNQDLSTLDPETLDILRRYGRLGPGPTQPTPSVSSKVTGEGESFDDAGEPLDSGVMSLPRDPNVEVIDQGAPAQAPSHGKFYVGSPEDRKRERVNKNVESVIQQIKGDPNLSELEKIVRINTALENEGTLPAGFWNALEDEQDVLRYDPVDDSTRVLINPTTGKPVRTRGNQQIIQRSRPPREPRDVGTYLGPAQDMEGNVIPGKAVYTRNGRMVIEDMPAGIGGVGAKPTASSEANRAKIAAGFGIPPNIWGAFISASSPTAGGADQEGKRLAALDTILGVAQVDQDVKDTIRDIFSGNVPGQTPESINQLSTNDILDMASTGFQDANGKFEEPQWSQFKNLITALRGNN